MSPISNASRLADFGSGIGTQGAIIQVDNTNARLGIGTTNPQAMLQVGTGVSVYGNAGIVSATSFWGDGSNLDGVTSSGLGTALNADDENLPESTPLQHVFKAARILHIGAGTSVRVDSDATSGNMAFMREADTFIAAGATFTIGAGTSLISDALGIFKPVV
tara:strand:- start:925 stop:1410 length:486 start_codon:yes stop_codon:yes gene_type:complete